MKQKNWSNFSWRKNWSIFSWRKKLVQFFMRVKTGPIFYKAKLVFFCMQHFLVQSYRKKTVFWRRIIFAYFDPLKIVIFYEDIFFLCCKKEKTTHWKYWDYIKQKVPTALLYFQLSYKADTNLSSSTLKCQRVNDAKGHKITRDAVLGIPKKSQCWESQEKCIIYIYVY